MAEDNYEDLDDSIKFIFEEYNQAKDGQLTRREFFTFLWDLKQTASQRLNEGQMMSCWMQVDSAGKGSVNMREFKTGIEICYEKHFFAVENGAPIPEPVQYTPDMLEQPPPPKEEAQEEVTYNTMKFQKSAGVAAFDAILKDEARQKTQDKKPAAPTPAHHAPKREQHHAPRELREKFQQQASETNVIPVDKRRSSSISEKPTMPLNPKVKMDELAREKEIKRKEAEEKLLAIQREKFRKEREAREAARKAKLDQEKEKNQSEAYESTQQPEWMKKLKERKSFSK